MPDGDPTAGALLEALQVTDRTRIRFEGPLCESRRRGGPAASNEDSRKVFLCSQVS